MLQIGHGPRQEYIGPVPSSREIVERQQKGDRGIVLICGGKLWIHQPEREIERSIQREKGEPL